PIDHLGAALEICDVADAELSIPASQALVIAIADHLSFAVRRHQDDARVEYPLAWEIAQLYPTYAAVGRRALDIVRARLG
ncbi:PRD domain-containing protein, partial [Sedimentibacter sp. B4]|uniref:PRD domain-containing protein n=1 Tax=Sedimentibacter sp. B4 TaxID=304766 RepID=UPI0018DCB300